MLITEAQVEHALKCLHDWQAAKARAAHEFLEGYTKTLIAELGEQANEAKSQAAKEDFARKHPEFKAHLEKLRDAAELDYMHRQRLSAAAAIIDLYRTDAANTRVMERVR
jgi:hypothetical protein